MGEKGLNGHTAACLRVVEVKPHARDDVGPLRMTVRGNHRVVNRRAVDRIEVNAAFGREIRFRFRGPFEEWVGLAETGR